MKKLIYLILFLPLFLCLNVNAWTLGQPYVNYEFANAPFPTGGYATEQTHYNTVFYISPFLLGGVDYSDYVKSVYFSWYNTGFCAGQDISISGTLYGGGYGTTNGLFVDESVSTVIKNNGTALSCVFNNVGGQLMNFQCYGKGGGDFNAEFHLNSYHQPNQYLVGISKEIAISCDASNLDVISNATANTNAIISNQDGNTQVIINNQNDNTQDIIDNQNDNTQDIIDNQNQNTQQQIESQKVCKNIDKSSIVTPGYFIHGTSQTLIQDPNFGITDYIPISSSTIEVLTTRSGNAGSCFYDTNKEIISCVTSSNLPIGFLTIPNNASYFRASISITYNKPTFHICTNGNQALTDSITDTSSPNTDEFLSELENQLPSDTPISDLILMPITLLGAFVTGINSTCSPVNLGSLYGTDLILPCIDLESRLGSNLWNIIDIVFCIFMCYNIGMLFVSAWDGLTGLRDDFSSLYQPKHADTGYQPKHGG